MKSPTIQGHPAVRSNPDNKINQLVKGEGIPKGEMFVLAAESDKDKPAFPRRYTTSSKLTDAKLSAAGGCIIVFLHIFIFLAKVAEWFWSILPDKCKGVSCRRMGIRGNENEVDGILLCDYCAYLDLWSKERANRE